MPSLVLVQEPETSFRQLYPAFKRPREIAYDFNGVSKDYAIQAGREIRVIVESEKVSDSNASELSFQISQKIQTDMTYPGQVKVTVIRETRAVNVAKSTRPLKYCKDLRRLRLLSRGLILESSYNSSRLFYSFWGAIDKLIAVQNP